MDSFQATRCLFESNSTFQLVSHTSSAIQPPTAADFSPHFTNDCFFFQFETENPHNFTQEKQRNNNFKSEGIQHQLDTSMELHNTGFFPQFNQLQHRQEISAQCVDQRETERRVGQSSVHQHGFELSKNLGYENFNQYQPLQQYQLPTSLYDTKTMMMMRQQNFTKVFSQNAPFDEDTDSTQMKKPNMEMLIDSEVFSNDEFLKIQNSSLLKNSDPSSKSIVIGAQQYLDDLLLNENQNPGNMFEAELQKMLKADDLILSNSCSRDLGDLSPSIIVKSKPVISFETLSSSAVSMKDHSSVRKDEFSSLNDASPQAANYLQVPKFHSSKFSSSMSGYSSSTDDSMQKKKNNINEVSSMQIQESLQIHLRYSNNHHKGEDLLNQSKMAVKSLYQKQKLMEHSQILSDNNRDNQSSLIINEAPYYKYESSSEPKQRESCCHKAKSQQERSSSSESRKSKEDSIKKQSASCQKHRKVISKCTHSSESYYANGMCKNCYHARGRTKLATKCDHKDRALYAQGICKNCYLSIYHKNKRNIKKGSLPIQSSTSSIEENVSSIVANLTQQ